MQSMRLKCTVCQKALGDLKKRKEKKIIVPTLLSCRYPAVHEDLEKPSPDSDADADHILVALDHTGLTCVCVCGCVWEGAGFRTLKPERSQKQTLDEQTCIGKNTVPGKD